MKKYLLISLVFLLLAGCRREKRDYHKVTVQFSANGELAPAAASSVSPSPTKVNGVNFDAGDEIAVFAARAGQPITGTYDADANGSFKNRVYVAGSANNFLPKTPADVIQYSSADQQFDFYVLYPNAGPGGVRVDPTTYKVDLGTITDQRTTPIAPYLFSDDAKNKGVTSGIVALTFKYVFAKVVLSINYDPTEAGDLIDAYFFADDGLQEACEIDMTQSTYDLVAVSKGGLATLSNPYKFKLEKTPNTEMTFYISPTLTTGPFFRLLFKGVGSSGTLAFLAKINVPVGGYVYAASKEYRYRVTVIPDDREPITISATVEDWIPVGDPNEIISTD